MPSSESRTFARRIVGFKRRPTLSLVCGPCWPFVRAGHKDAITRAGLGRAGLHSASSWTRPAGRSTSRPVPASDFDCPTRSVPVARLTSRQRSATASPTRRPAPARVATTGRSHWSAASKSEGNCSGWMESCLSARAFTRRRFPVAGLPRSARTRLPPQGSGPAGSGSY